MLIRSSFQTGFIYALGYVISNNAIIVVNIKTSLKYSYENFRKLVLLFFFPQDSDLQLLMCCTIGSLLMAFSFCHCQLLYLKSIQLRTIYKHYEALHPLHPSFCTDSYGFKAVLNPANQMHFA